MKYKVEVDNYWSKSVHYFSKLYLARVLGEFAINDGKPVKIYEETDDGWKEII